MLYNACNKIDWRNQRFIVITLYDFSQARNAVSGWDANEQNERKLAQFDGKLSIDI